MQGKVICSDLDGTLFYPKSKLMVISRKNRAFIRRFIDDGGRFVVVTSRGPLIGEKISRAIKRNVDIISCNGGHIIINGKVVYETSFLPNEANEVVELIENDIHPWCTLFTSENHNLVMRGDPGNLVYWPYRIWQGRLGEQFEWSTKVFNEQLKQGKIYKLIFCIGISKKKKVLAEKLTEELKQKYPHLSIHWSNEIIEISPKGVSKSSGISFYLDKNNISKDNILVIGDSGNDVPMFHDFPKQSYCMKHGPASVKKEATHIIRRFSDLEKVLYPSEDRKSLLRRRK